MIRVLSIAFISCLVTTGAWAQPSGSHTYDFLRMPAHARLSALGGVNVSLADRDVNFFQNNPALAGDTLSGSVSAGYQFFVGGIGNAAVSGAFDGGRLGLLMAGLQHTDYGVMKGYDDSGNAMGEFSAGETAIMVATAREAGNFRLGVTVKAVFSSIAGYRASALMADIGGIFRHPGQDLIIGLALKNLGVHLSGYHDGVFSELPFDVQAGVTFKPEHMPVRFSLTGHRLAGEWTDSGNTAARQGLQKVMRHVTAGAEILFHRNVNALVGYNFMLRQALSVENAASPAGLSLGLSVLVRPVELIVSRSAYTVGNAGYTFTLNTNLNELLNRRND